MSRSTEWNARRSAAACLLMLAGQQAGCRATSPELSDAMPPRASLVADSNSLPTATVDGDGVVDPIQQVDHEAPLRFEGRPLTPGPIEEASLDTATALFDDGNPTGSDHPVIGDALPALEASALATNPALRRLQQETAAAWAKSRSADKLPDPTIGANVFGHPIETAAGSQRANLSAMQMIPWLERLDAQAQQACYEALSMEQQYHAERLRVIGDLRVNWAKLYVLGRQLETIEANQQLLTSLSDLVTTRLALNRGSAGDVTLITVELGRLEEQALTTRQQIASTKAAMNRLAGRPSAAPIAVPASLPDELPEWTHEMLRQLAWERQPAIASATLRTSASRWGIEVARLRRRPDVSLGASYFIMDNNRPPSRMVDVGRDAWSLGAQVSLPLWADDYDAIENEATWKHFAASASVRDLQLEYDALLRDLWEQARAASETAALYRDTIIPQAQQTLDSDQQALANGTVDLDRVIQDIRNLLMLELSYDRALGQLATSLARIRQAVGIELASAASPVALPAPQLSPSAEHELPR